MIAAIGIMIGCYVLVRMLALLTRPADRREHRVVRIAAAVTCVVTVFVMASLWFGVGSSPSLR